MAREAISERGLPSPEVRRQILQHAGMILHEARELVQQLDRHETAYPRTACEQRKLLWEKSGRPYLPALASPAKPATAAHEDSNLAESSDRVLSV